MSSVDRPLPPSLRKFLLVAGVATLASFGARAQPIDPQGPDPLGELVDKMVQSAPDEPPPPAHAITHPLSGAEAAQFRQAIDLARRGDVNGARAIIAGLNDPLARKTATWVLVDSNADSLGFRDVDAARRDLAGWPRPAKRQAAAERLIESSGLGPQQVAEWFSGAEPTTPQGAMALASAERMLGRSKEANQQIRRWWRDRSFDVEPQRAMLARFGDALTQEDHNHRADMLLYGSRGPAAREMIPLLPAELQAAALTRLALRAEARDASERFSALSPELAQSPGVAFERAAYLRRKGQDAQALALVANFPHEVTSPDQGDRIWDERRHLVLSALRAGDARAAYAAAADSGLTTGPDAADAEFDAGWIALTKLQDAPRAARHFAKLEKVGTSPITLGRALYWEGRAAEASGDHDEDEKRAADRFYRRAAQYNTTFYGLLAGEKLGRSLALTQDPVISPSARARFEAREPIQATRLLFDYGPRDLFRVFVLNLSDLLPTPEDEAQLIDLARGYGEMDISMKAGRTAAQRGFILPDRAYPVRSAPDEGAEPALVLAITRQESGFDPNVRSGAGARGMMQLMPTTAKLLARKIGISYSPGQLDEPEYNMRLGSRYLGQLVSQFSGSYVMAIAGYNAGPGRPAQWSGFCGDPRGGQTDPVDFVECIPFSETRNYVMRVMENVQVYRAKLNGGASPISLTADLKRGAYSYTPASQQTNGEQPSGR